VEEGRGGMGGNGKGGGMDASGGAVIEGGWEKKRWGVGLSEEADVL